MVSLWPFRGDEVASFEKTLSSLTEKISRSNVKRDRLRTRSRRVKGLWTVYTSFAYLLYTLITVLVTGRRNWGAVEFLLVGGTPILIYLVWLALNTYYSYRLSSTDNYLKDLYAQREAVVENFKKATKYNTTHQLLEKYGVATPDQQNQPKSSHSPVSSHVDSEPTNELPSAGNSRTQMPPPPTANIGRHTTLSDDSRGADSSKIATSSSFKAQERPKSLRERPEPRNSSIESKASFAPNAFVTSRKNSDAGFENVNWYDRVIDLLLGEDETRPINRLALICLHCRLVNGQAPPGVKHLEEVGSWRCSGCGEWNNRTTEIETLLHGASTEVADTVMIERLDKNEESKVDMQDDSKTRNV